MPAFLVSASGHARDCYRTVSGRRGRVRFGRTAWSSWCVLCAQNWRVAFPEFTHEYNVVYNLARSQESLLNLYTGWTFQTQTFPNIEMRLGEIICCDQR